MLSICFNITKIQSFIKKHNWKGINFPSEKDDWKKFEKNDRTIALDFLHAKKAKLCPSYVSKRNSNPGKQVIHVIIPYGEGWYYLALKKLSV